MHTTPRPGLPTRPSRRLLATAIALAAGATTLAIVAPSPAGATAPPEITGIASQPSTFTNSNGITNDARPSGDGRFIVFTSDSTNLVPGTTTAVNRVYLHDLWTDGVTLISHTSAGAPNAVAAKASAISNTGAYVTFATGDKLTSADTNAFNDVYLWTRATDTVELVSKTWNNGVGDGDSGMVAANATGAVSDDGRYVAFVSKATNLNPSTDSNGKADIFRHDRTTGANSTVSISGALQANGDSYQPDMSANGRYVVFATNATNLGGTDTNGFSDVWRRDFSDISPTKVSVGLDADANGSSLAPRISDDGSKVAFESSSTDLVSGDTNAKRDIFVRNITASTTTRVSVHDSTGAQLTADSSAPDISPGGAEVVFNTVAQASSSDTDSRIDVYDRVGTSTVRKSVTTAGAPAEQNALGPAIGDGIVTWTSTGAFATTDTSTNTDAFFRYTPFLGTFTNLDDFLTTQYARFRGAFPDATEQAAEKELINAGASPFHFIIQLTDEAAFSGKRAPLVRLYWAYFKRRPDLNGLNYWLNKYNGGKRLVDISQEFAKSSEFKTKYGNTTPEQFVTLVFQNVLEREPDPGGLAYWSNKIKNGTPRGQVMTNFSESSEGKRVIGPRADMILVAIGMYGKIPTQTLFDAAVTDRRNGYPREIIPAYVLGAPEYINTLP